MKNMLPFIFLILIGLQFGLLLQQKNWAERRNKVLEEQLIQFERLYSEAAKGRDEAQAGWNKALDGQEEAQRLANEFKALVQPHQD